MLGSKFKKPPVLQKSPRGLGRTSLCADCNGLTAKYYGAAFAAWTTQCLRYADHVARGSKFLLPYRIEPLAVLKQVATMILAASGESAHSATIEALRQFILSPMSSRYPASVDIVCYMNPRDERRVTHPTLTQNRLSGSCAVLDVSAGASVFVIGEVAFPPMGYAAYLDIGTRVSDDFASLCHINRFAQWGYGSFAEFHMQMPVRRPFGPVPGYYPELGRGGVPILDDNHIVVTTRPDTACTPRG